MKAEDSDMLRSDKKRGNGKAGHPLERTRNALRSSRKVEAENRNDEIEYKGQDLRGLFKAHLGETKMEERQNLRDLFKAHLHTDLHHELKMADDAANEAIQRK